MKRILLLTTVLAGSLLIFKPANAQFSASINIGVQPEWGPSGYDYAENYYLPDVEAYYSVPRHQFVYFDRGNWVYANSLPARCGNYDLYSGYKVVLNGRDPWMHFNDHRAMYSSYRYRHDQRAIRDFHGGDYGRGGYAYGNRGFDNRGRNWGRNDNYDHRQDRGRGDDRRFDNNRRGNDHNDRGRERGRW